MPVRGKFGRQDVEIISRKSTYRGFFSMEKLRLRHRLFSGGWSAELNRELFRRGNAVGVLLYDPLHGLVALVEQFRVGALSDARGPWQLEVVAGMVNEGESGETCARRELLEEAGIAEVKLKRICEYLVSPGGTDETHELWCAMTDLRGKGGIFGQTNEHEDIMLQVMPVADAIAELTSGRANNAATCICLQWLQLNRSRLHNEIE